MTDNNKPENNETVENTETETVDMENTETVEQDELEVPELSLEVQLEQAQNELLLAHADVQNMRRRTDEEISNAKKFGASSLARDLFTVNDNLQMALQSITDEDKENIPALKNLAFGLDMVATEFTKAFEKNAIKKILPQIGDDFDHNHHQAMGEIETDEVDAGKIAQVMSAGYLLHDRLLKPAMVNTAKK